MKRHEHSSFKPLRWSIILPVLLLGVLLLGVIIIMSIPIEPYFPPEDPEITAKRLSPENGFYTLISAEQLMDPLMAGQVWPAWNKSATEALESGWPDDPQTELELLWFFDQAAPAIAEMRKALEEEYYLQPEISFEAQVPSLTKSKTMAQVLGVQAKWYEKEGNYQEAMRNYLDILRFGNLIRSDGFLVNEMIGIAVEEIGLEAAQNALLDYPDPDILREALDVIQQLEEHTSPLSKTFEYDFRGLEKTIFSGMLNHTVDLHALYGSRGLNLFDRTVAWIPGVRDVMFRIDVVRFMRNRVDFYEETLKSADEPYYIIKNTSPTVPSDPLSRVVFPSLTRSKLSISDVQALERGLMILIALRLHHIEHSTYPADVYDLMPDYLDVIPMDPFTGKEFHYEKVGDDFLLYSLSNNGIDDGGVGPSFTGDLIIYMPSENGIETSPQIAPIFAD